MDRFRSHFFIYMTMMALAIAGTTILYFSQMNLLYQYFDADTVYLLTISAAYLAQGLGLLMFMFLFHKKPVWFGNRFVLTGMLISVIPLTFLSLLISSGAVLVVLLILTNLVIGFILGNCFTNIGAFVEKGKIGLCFGAGYALGNFLSWLLSQIDTTFITSIKIIPVVCVVIGFAIIPAMKSDPLSEKEGTENDLSSQSKSVSAEETRREAEEEKSWKQRIRRKTAAVFSRLGINDPKNVRHFLWLLVILFFMSVIYTISSTDYSMIAETRGISSTFYTRIFYAAGLVLAGFIYDKSSRVGAILALASITYPIIGYMLLKLNLYVNLTYCFSFFFLGFFAVYRSGVFISMGNQKRELLYLAGFGMLISRWTEGLFSLFNVWIARTEVGGFLLSGFLYVPLIILFCMESPEKETAVLSEEEKIADLSEKYGLTRREEEILSLLVHSATNGEIAATLTISESTARFHVSNVLKKTGCKTRNDLIHQFVHYSR